LYSDYKHKEEIKEFSAQYEFRSNFIGSIGTNLETDFTLIESKYIPLANSYIVYGYTADGNLISYWANDKSKICKQGRIKGRVKKQEKNPYRGDAKVTVLNYVKVL
jgi:hypothetical protein